MTRMLHDATLQRRTEFCKNHHSEFFEWHRRLCLLAFPLHWIIGTCPLNYNRVRYEASVSLGETTAQSLVSAIHCQASEPQPTPRDSSTHDERATRTAGSTLFV